MERVAYEYCEELKRHNVLYFELRHNPMSKKMTPEEYVEGVTAGLERGEKDFGVKSRQIVIFMRGKPGTVRVKFILVLSYDSLFLSHSSPLPPSLSLPPSLPPSLSLSLRGGRKSSTTGS